jgi:exopolyphosphatase/guanosine-5'-triphosphate,3'-diphosphate pyrophosphatase
MSSRLSVIDCGTNSTRVLVSTDGLEAVCRKVVLTRLGEGIGKGHSLAGEALARFERGLEDLLGLARSQGAEVVRVLATSAVRELPNPSAVLEVIKRLTGLEAEVIPGWQEARLAFRGAAWGRDPKKPLLVVDIGGGSTEVVVGYPGEVGREAGASLDIGCVRITERFLCSDPPTREELSRARSHLAQVLSRVSDRIRSRVEVPPRAVGLAGTVHALAAISVTGRCEGEEKVDGAVIEIEWVKDLVSRLAAMSSEERSTRYGLPRLRADVVLAGALILEAIGEAFGLEDVEYSERDLLDGALIDWLARNGRLQ